MNRWIRTLKRRLKKEGVTDVVFRYAGSGHLCLSSPVLKGRVFISATPKEQVRTLRNVLCDVRRMKKGERHG